jgi:transcription elongation factor Elf1
MKTIKWSSVESVPKDGNYQMVICGICTYRWKLSNGRLWNLYVEMETIKWSSVGSVARDGNYQMVVCGICT